MSAKHWTFTLNNYTVEEYIKILEVLDGEQVEYGIVGKETGDEGTPHLQGYVVFNPKRRFNAVKNSISPRAHIERAKGNPSQNRKYCSKDGDFEERGKLPSGQGQRSDLGHCYSLIKSGKSFKDVADADPGSAIRYSTGLLRVAQLFRPTRTQPPEIHVFWGPTSSGKTSRVWEFANLEKLWVHPGQSWFCGYMGHESVLFDDFDGGWFKITYLLKLLDRYVFMVPVKGGQTWWNPEHIYITSNIEPKMWFPSAHEEHRRALMRRLTEFGTITHCVKE